MNSLPSVQEILGLLDALKRTVRDFVAREDKINGDLRIQTAIAHAEFAAVGEQQESAANLRLTDAHGVLAAVLTQNQIRLERRRRRVARAYDRLAARGNTEISEHDRRWSERTREIVAGLEQQREAGLARAAAEQEQFRQQVTEAEAALDQARAAARSAFRGYNRFRRLLDPDRSWPEPEADLTHPALLEEALRRQGKLKADLARFQKLPLPLLFRFVPVRILGGMLLGVALADPVLTYFGRHDLSPSVSGLAFAALILLVVIHALGGRAAAPLALALASESARAGRLLARGREKNDAFYAQEHARLATEFETRRDAAHQAWRQAVRDINQQRDSWPALMAEKAARLERHLDQWHTREAGRIQARQAAIFAELKAQDLAAVEQNLAAHEARLAALQNEHQLRLEQAVTDWKREVPALCDRLAAASAAAEKQFPPWTPAAWENWTPPAEFQNAVKFGCLEVSVKTFLEGLPVHAGFAWPGPAAFVLPLALVCPLQGSILFESGKGSGEEAFAVINNIIFRLLSAAPPGRLNFTIFDPVRT